MAVGLSGIRGTDPSTLLLPHLPSVCARGCSRHLATSSPRFSKRRDTNSQQAGQGLVWLVMLVALGWAGAGWPQQEGPHADSCLLSSCCKRHMWSSKGKWRTYGLKIWLGFVGSHGGEQTWPEAQPRHVHAGENTACTVCALEAHSAPGSERSSTRIQN